MLDSFLCNQYLLNKDSINLATKDLNQIFIKLAKESKMIRPNAKSNKKQAKEQWFDNECSLFRKHLRNLSNKKHNDPENQDLRHEYHTALKQYKKMINQKKTKYTEVELIKTEKAIDKIIFGTCGKNVIQPKMKMALKLKMVTFGKTISQMYI